MGLYKRVKSRQKTPPTSGGLLQRTLKARDGEAAGAAGRGAAPDRAARQPARPAPAAIPARAPIPAGGQTQFEDLASAVSRLEASLDSCPLLFELLVRTLGLQGAVLYLADYARGALVPCAFRGLPLGAAQPVTGRVESLFETDALRRLDTTPTGPFGDLADGSELTIKPYRSGDAPAGALLFRRPTLGDDALSEALGRAEIASLLSASSEQVSGFPLVSLESLDGVRPAGATMLLSISYEAVTAALAARAPSLNPAWLTDVLQRIVARLLAPLGRVGERTDSPVALLTPRTMDPELLAHQISLLLARYVRSVRPLPGLVVAPLA